MDDHDVFAILTASDKRNKASSAFNLPQNAKWFRRATGGVADKPTLDSREPTPADEELSAKHVASAGNRLVLTFDELLKSSVFDGVHFGTNPRSLALRVEFPNHHDADPRYINNLENIAKIIQEAIPAVDGLGLDSAPTTATPSQVQTPGQRSIYYKVKRIGQGGFGEVHKVIRVRDGEYFAAKTFQPPANKRKRDEAITELLSMIRREFNMMKDNPHPNVIQVVEFQEKPEPLIVMDYYPLGNFVDAGIVDENVCVTALGQLLDGLDHLHKNAVAHRDLKPENILVTREPFLKVDIRHPNTSDCPRAKKDG
ncbi:hypothetical protein G6O67_005315 [Ophiocordyceps sinensis]|uniref:Protein kinase domain-containing protein n=1 Tax=Ophiocordyceps sinensis TaxID=72228 RepID=A0A8H4V618_9HYPO|nr:hypothetical protein G6O67_005315 [Ophiocordyceps sinensis]